MSDRCPPCSGRNEVRDLRETTHSTRCHPAIGEKVHQGDTLAETPQHQNPNDSCDLALQGVPLQGVAK